MSKIETLRKWIDESNHIVAFTGAGVSTESGIKDFRSPDGLYNEKGWTNSRTSTEICELAHHRG
jgi:NAD-dependent deacetylase